MTPEVKLLILGLVIFVFILKSIIESVSKKDRIPFIIVGGIIILLMFIRLYQEYIKIKGG